MTESLASIIAKVEAKKTPEEQAEVLKKNSSAALKQIIGYALDPGVKWLLPEGTPPYKAAPKESDVEGRLHKECRRFIYFVQSPESAKLTRTKREELFIQMLEIVDPDDAKLCIRVKDRTLNISRKAAELAFPNLTKKWAQSGWAKQPVKRA